MRSFNKQKPNLFTYKEKQHINENPRCSGRILTKTGAVAEQAVNGPDSRQIHVELDPD